MSKTTFVVTGDIHWSGRTPLARSDHYPTTMAAKLREVHQIASDVGAAAILQPGDLTDSVGIGYGPLQDLAHILKEAPCPWISIPGNHDREGGNPATDQRSPWGMLAAAGLIQSATEPIDFPDVTVTGHGYDHETDVNKDQYGIPYMMALQDRIFVHLAHGMLLTRSPGIDMRHTLVDEIPDLPLPPDVLICGHYHLPLGIRRVGKTLVINPGALCRLAAHIEEIERTVQVAILSISTFRGIDAELVPIQCAQPGPVVLSRQHIEEAAERELRLTRFLDLLQAEQEHRQTDLVAMIDDMSHREQIPDHIKQEALRRLSSAQEALAHERGL